MMTTPPGPTISWRSRSAACSQHPRCQAVPGVAVYFFDRLKIPTVAGPLTDPFEPPKTPTLERHQPRRPLVPASTSVAPPHCHTVFEGHFAIDSGRASHPAEQRLATPPRRPDGR